LNLAAAFVVVVIVAAAVAAAVPASVYGMSPKYPYSIRLWVERDTLNQQK
jgi:hypothetical protein